MGLSLADYGYLSDPTLRAWLITAGIWLVFDLVMRLRRRKLPLKREVVDIIRLVTLIATAILTGFWLKTTPVSVAIGVLVTLYVTIWAGAEGVKFLLERKNLRGQ